MQVPRRCLQKRIAQQFWAVVSLLVCYLAAGPMLVWAQEVESYVSSKLGDRLARQGALQFQTGEKPQKPDFQIDPAVTYQTIAGFGASFLEAGMICLNSLPEAEQEAVLRALFDPEKGAGFSVMKTVIAGTDFMSAGPWYTYNDTPGDVEMKHFSIERDLGPNGLITFIKRARKYGPFVLQAPMDYPPDWMLFDVAKNQDVNPKYFDALALYYLRYLQEYEKNGVFIDYLSLFNEPDIYTKIPYDKIRDLLKNHVGPLLAKEGIKSKIMLSESPDRTDAFKNYPILLDDPEARKYVSVMPYHGYRLKEPEKKKMEYLRRRYPDLPLWQTEICHSYGAGTPRTMPIPRLDFEDGDFWGRQIVADLEGHACAWLYWNMILDQKGGPWLVSKVHEDFDNNVQHAVVIIDRDTKKVTYTGLYYYLAHFSKFVRPGAVRIKTSGSRPGVRCVAFKSPDRGLVAQLLNSRKTKAEVTLESKGKVLRLVLPPISITTCLWTPPE